MSCPSNKRYEINAPVKKWSSLLLIAAFGVCLPGNAVGADAVSCSARGVSNASARSVAGALHLPGEPSERKVFGMNVGWRFHKGEQAPEGVFSADFDDSKWARVNLPHGLEVLPEEASGGANYRGKAWYRKTFVAPQELQGRRNTLYFEGVMGKSEIWINGNKAAEHFGGYLPIVVDLKPWLVPGGKNVVVVMTDNADDASYPPGKPQDHLDFSYFGGIYRDVYLLSTGRVHITDPNEADTVAGGGIFFHTETLDAENGAATALVKVQANNGTQEQRSVQICAVMKDASGKEVARASAPLELPSGQKGEVQLHLNLSGIRAWSPEEPNLYRLEVKVAENESAEAAVLDDRALLVGLRTICLDGKGLTLNGKLYPEKLIGGNRHQDFATLGNAVPNNLQEQDAVKLRRAGMRVIRCAHYPMDPAFMDACDRLGLFVIVATPGWQFWGKGPFAERVFSDIRQMVRRDRNRPCILMWEPILNETHYPADFAQKAYDTVREEYPYAGCYSACDSVAKGVEPYDVLYAHPATGDKHWSIRERTDDRPYFTREFGDNVDDWSAHNSTSRAARRWGEVPMLVQAMHYLKTPFPYTTLETLNAAPPYHFGACLWHPFDHQRGYHPDPFYGGILDAFRQPKTAYYAFMSQRPVQSANELGSGPVVYIANECTPFSPKDVTVFSNCDSVRLSVNGEFLDEKRIRSDANGLKHEPAVFSNAWDFMENKRLDRDGKESSVRLVAEGIVDGKVVATHEVRPARRPEKIRLRLDVEEGQELMANGSDIIPVIAEVTDRRGTVKRLNDEEVVFTVEGPAELVTEAPDGTLTRAVAWGTAPALVRLATQPGQVTVRASVRHAGSQKPVSGSLRFETQADGLIKLFDEDAVGRATGDAEREVSDRGPASEKERNLRDELEKTRAELNRLRNEQVGRQQTHFE